ncbi:MAG: M17 family metallopeptidase [Eubacteriales bacterium]|nr:M17 family metallopeptidase [Eubacteriales bacterium]
MEERNGRSGGGCAAQAILLWRDETNAQELAKLWEELTGEDCGWEAERVAACFRGTEKETYAFPLHGIQWILLGLGERRTDISAPLRAREAGAALAKACRALELSECTVRSADRIRGRREPSRGKAGSDSAGVAPAAPERQKSGAKEEKAVWQCNFMLGLLTGNYEFSLGRAQRGELFREKCRYYLPEEAEALIPEMENLAQGLCFVRDLVNLPGNLLRPEELARRILVFAGAQERIEAELLSLPQLKEKGLRALCAVGESSKYPPCMAILRYRGASQGKTYGLIGKGVTCDTGGYCLKKADGMAGIKGDMAGAAAVAGAIRALAQAQAPVNVVACLPLCENRISRSALLPGDVITGYSGKTIEILNTDAEGRLILSDAISYALQAEQADCILDIATLTGAAWSALGYTIGASMSDDETEYAAFTQALERFGERYVRFPFGPEHRKMIQSHVADVKNTGSNCCGTITAGLFLREFAQGRPWIHLDIAGTAWCEEPAYSFESRGATGAGMLSLYEWLRERATYAGA